MPENSLTLKDLRVGDEKTIAIATTDSDGTAKDPTAPSWFGFWDTDRVTSGTIDSGSTSTMVVASRVEASQFWRGTPLALVKPSSATVASISYLAEVSQFQSATGTFRFKPIDETVSNTWTYKLLGYPLKVVASATITTNEGSILVQPSNVTGAPHKNVTMVYMADFGTDREACVGHFAVLAND